jgi:hypothetical protein
MHRVRGISRIEADSGEGFLSLDLDEGFTRTNLDLGMDTDLDLGPEDLLVDMDLYLLPSLTRSTISNRWTGGSRRWGRRNLGVLFRSKEDRRLFCLPALRERSRFNRTGAMMTMTMRKKWSWAVAQTQGERLRMLKWNPFTTSRSLSSIPYHPMSLGILLLPIREDEEDGEASTTGRASMVRSAEEVEGSSGSVARRGWQIWTPSARLEGTPTTGTDEDEGDSTGVEVELEEEGSEGEPIPHPPQDMPDRCKTTSHRITTYHTEREKNKGNKKFVSSTNQSKLRT